MNSKENNQNKKDIFLKYWESKRTNRVKYAILQSLYFAVPFSIVFQAIESAQGFLTLNFGFKLLTIFSVYFLLSFYISYNIHEKKYKKLKKQA